MFDGTHKHIHKQRLLYHLLWNPLSHWGLKKNCYKSLSAFVSHRVFLLFLKKHISLFLIIFIVLSVCVVLYKEHNIDRSRIKMGGGGGKLGYLLGTPDTSRKGRNTRKARSALTSNPAPLPPIEFAPSALVACSKIALKSLQKKRERRNKLLPGSMGQGFLLKSYIFI